MTRTLSFEVRGTPAPQGSKRHVGRGILIESSKKVKPWREDVRAAATAAMPSDWMPLDGAVKVDITFYLTRPKSTPKRIKWQTKRPDIDKLVRSTLDALTSAGVYIDDSHVITLNAHKRFVGTDFLEINTPGALIDIEGWDA